MKQIIGMIKRRPKWLDVVVVLAYFGVLALSFNMSIPLLEESDEAEHFLFIHYLLEENELPVIRERSEVPNVTTLAELWNNHTHHAPLYYLLGRVVIGWSDRADIDAYLRANDLIFTAGITANNPNKWLHNPYPPAGDTHVAIRVLRLVNTILGGLTLLAVYRTVLWAWGKHEIAWLAMLIVASIPSFVAVHASVTNDSLVIFLYSVGMLCLVRIWHKRQITLFDCALISLIVTGAALSKLTGLSLLGVIGVVLLIGAWRKHLPMRSVIWTLLAMVVTLLLLAGWWYARNWMLYGDPFALQATQSLWGREFDLSTDRLSIGQEIERILRSFWLMIGYRHQPLLASDALSLFAFVITSVAGVGVVHRWRIDHAKRSTIMIFSLLISVNVMALIVGTRNVDISYGRILFPALVGFGGLVALGLATLGRWGVLLSMPLIAFAITTPSMIQNIYPHLTILMPLESPKTTLSAESIMLSSVTIAPKESMMIDMIFTGYDEANPALLLTAVDPINGAEVGRTTVYPGLVATDWLSPNGRYQTQIPLSIEAFDDIHAPRVLDLYFSWLYIDRLHTTDPQRFEGALLVDPRYQAPLTEERLQAVFSNGVTLQGYGISRTSTGLDVQLRWQPKQAIPDDWTLTIQLFNDSGDLVAQADGVPASYPTSRWLVSQALTEQRTLTLPQDMAEGVYQLYVGWYRLENLRRASVLEGIADNDLLYLTDILIDDESYK